MATEGAGTPLFRRVLIALDSFRDDEAALEFAAALAQYSHSELVALFIQDVNLANIAGLSFVREVDQISAALRDFGEAQLARAMRARTENVRRSLQRISERVRVSCTVQVTQGQYLVEATAAASEMDILLLMNPAAGALFRAVAETQEKASAVAAEDAIWVLYDGSESAGRALALGLALARDRNLRLTVLLRPHAPDGMEDLRRRAGAAIPRDHGLRGYAILAIGEDLRPPDALRRARCRLLLMPRAYAPEFRERRPGAWTALVHSPVVLIP